jgi:hypothetical protein
MPSLWRQGLPKTSRRIRPVSTAIAEYRCGQPRWPLRGGVHAAIAAGVTHTVKSPGGAALHHNPAGSSRGSGHLDPVEALLINLVGHAVLGFGRPPLYLAASPCDLPTDLRANVSITAKIHDLAEYRVCHVQHFALQQNSRRAGAETQRRLSIMKVARQI